MKKSRKALLKNKPSRRAQEQFQATGAAPAGEDSALEISLQALVERLLPTQNAILLEMARAMTTPIESHIDPDSDIVTPEFAESFSNRLLIHHATQEEKFNKKGFEFAFKRASQAAGRDAMIIRSQTNPGEDVVVDGVAFSLKTEADQSIRFGRIKISKFMEARWIRDCQTSQDFERETKRRILNHLSHYQRILVLRAFDEAGPKVHYDLVEIPHRMLSAVSTLTSSDFSARTGNGSSGADVVIDGTTAFRVRLDGSVEKVTISGIDIDLCQVHASWTIPVLVF